MDTAQRKFPRIVTLAAIIYASLTLPVRAQTFDTSGNSLLKGDYFVRQLITANPDPGTGAIGRAFSLTGVMTFDGQGNYTVAGKLLDTQAGTTAQAFSATGVYAVASSGLAQIQNPIDATEMEEGGVSSVGPAAIVASATEGNYRDLFVAIPAGSAVSNSSVTGSYKAAFIDFPQADATQVRDGYYTLTSTGSGSFGSVRVNGAMANQGSNDVQQVFSGVTFSIDTANGSGTLKFPTASTPLAALVSGTKTLYVSADGNLLLAGDPNGFDLIVGVKSISGAASNEMFQGTYFAAGLENDGSGAASGFANIDSFNGSILALGAQGAAVAHYRLAYADFGAFDYTTDVSFNFATDGTYNDGIYQHSLGAKGKADVAAGSGPSYSLIVELAAQPALVTDVFIDPLKIFNAASFAPVTNSIAPGEFLTLFGSGLSSTTMSASVPLPATLGGVQATVNGRPAPLSFVSATQVNIQVPFKTTEAYATLQITNNGVASNKVTLYTNATSPGIFTLTKNDGTFPPGVGPAAVLHADYSLVTAEHGAKPGETLQLFVTGLGSVTPGVADGAAAPSVPLSTVDETILVDILDENFVDTDAQVTFAGLAPGFAGLYQINFVVPDGVASGVAWVNISTDEAYTSEAKLYVQ